MAHYAMPTRQQANASFSISGRWRASTPPRNSTPAALSGRLIVRKADAKSPIPCVLPFRSAELVLPQTPLGPLRPARPFQITRRYRAIKPGSNLDGVAALECRFLRRCRAKRCVARGEDSLPEELLRAIPVLLTDRACFGNWLLRFVATALLAILKKPWPYT
jgi:hypothetical protein